MYRNKELLPRERAEDLLSRMTLEEKLMQMNIYCLDKAYDILSEKGKLETRGCIFCSSNNKERINEIQEYYMTKTRLGIPVLFAFEAIRGLQDKQATVFPQCAGVGGTFNKTLVSEISDIIGKESEILGIRQLYAPNLDIPRDPRWGRMQECYGEDPYLVGEMGREYVKGIQKHNVAATLKHFIAHGVPENGINLSPVHMGEREMREITLEPFKKCIEVGAMSVMPAYSELDGEPLHSSKRLLKALLRDELGFDGMVISDYGAIEMLHKFQSVAENKLEAGKMALDAGVDVEAPESFGYGDELKQAILNGEVDEKLIDNAVLNILTLKFKIGLFENPYAIPEKSAEVHNEDAVNLAREVEEQAIVMLENDGILPIDEKKINKVAIIGNNAKDSFLGDYIKFTKSCVSFYDGMVNRLGEERVLFAKGCNSISGTDEMIADAVGKAKQADVVFLVLGDTAAEGGGVAGDGIDDKEVTCAEGYDMHALSLTPSQHRLFNEITALDKPVVFVLYSGRAMALEEEAKKVNALLFSWGAGEQSGNAFANLIFGNVSPSAKLSISMPRSVGHIPCHYNYKVSARGSWYKKPGSIETPGRDYVLSSPNALYPFGYGLSYTHIEYSELKAKNIKDGQIRVSVKVQNVGNYDICESVLLYTKAVYSPVTPFVKQLKRFDKIELKKGETKVVEFFLCENDFTYIDKNYKETKLKGKHKILVDKLECDIDV